MSQVKRLLKVNPERLGNYDFLVGVKNSPSVRSVKPFDIAVLCRAPGLRVQKQRSHGRYRR